MNKQEILKQVEKVKSQTTLLNLSSHKVLHDYVIVVPASIEEPGITKQTAQYEDRPDIGVVVGFGDDVEGVEVGDVAFFGQYSHFQVTHDDIQYLIMRAEDIFCVAKA